MSYLSAANKAISSEVTNPPPGKQLASKKVEEPPPVQVEEEEDQLTEPVEEDDLQNNDEEDNGPIEIVRTDDNRKNIGIFTRIEFATSEKEDEFWKTFAIAAGPGGLCNFALTCTYLYDKLMTPEMWALVEPQLLPVISPTVNFLIETAVDSNGEKLLTLNVTSLKNPKNYQIQGLVNHWLRVVSNTEAAEPKNAVLPGGFSIETGNAKNTKQLYYLQDLSLVSKVVQAINNIIEQRLSNRRTERIQYRNGNLILSRYGRGGHLISFHVNTKKEKVFYVFPLDEFANQIRKATKKFLPLVSRSLKELKKIKTTPDPAFLSFQEKDTWITDLFQKTEKDAKTALNDIRRKLEAGVVPGSSLPDHFQKKKSRDDSRRTQDEIENANIWELIIENLPTEEWEKAVDAARNLQSYAINERDNEQAERKAKKDREKAQRDAERNQDFSIDEGDKKNKKTSVVFSTDDKGWIHQKVVDKEGKELEKPKSETVTPKPKKTVTATKTVNEKSNPSNYNIYDLPEDAENVPSKAEYMDTVRSSRIKGKVDKTPVKYKASKASPEKEPKEKKEPKVDKKQPKSEKKKRSKNLLQKRNRLFLIFLSGRMSYLNLWFMYSGSFPSYLSFTYC